jgi:heme/copper-type cytochrome/quinol oxidase subunit 2
MASKGRAIEILSVIITSLVLGYIGVIAGVQLIAVDTPPPNAPTVTVIGKQFYWAFVYPNGTTITWPNGTSITYPNGYTSENYLYVKAGQAVQLEVISTDVAHSFFIYELGIHIDAIPGHVNHFWLQVDTPGTYRIECTQFCGVGHYTMVGELIVTS